ncbi:MAG: ribosomal protein S18-alanine N-acetyltransferase [Candidatus Binataceae bacterium]
MANPRQNFPMGVTLRTATTRDLPRIMEIERRAFAHPWSRDSFAHELALPFSRTIIAIDPNGEHELIAGYLCRWIVADECHILNVAVHPQRRRLGVGAIMMADAIAEAKANRIQIITLEVRRSNLAARSLYRRFKFEEQRLRRNYYGVGEDAIVMELKLN